MSDNNKQDQIDETDAVDQVNEQDEQISELSETEDTSADEIARLKEDVIRVHAEMENIRKRSVRELEKARRYAQERLLADLLPVLDSLERGLATDKNEDGAHAKLIEGNELTLKILDKLLKDAGLVEINPVGEPFDPQRHEAMSMVPNPELEPNTVMDVWQKGYQLHDRVVRPAMVVVAKA